MMKLLTTKFLTALKGKNVRFQINTVRSSCQGVIREFKQITTAGATTVAVTEKVWGEYVSVV